MSNNKSIKNKLSKLSKDKEIYRRKLTGLILGLLGLCLLLFVVFYTVLRVFRPEDISKFLPADSTVAVVQIRIDNRHEQVKNFFSALDRHPVYQYENIVSLIEDFIGEDFDAALRPWVGRQVGLAVIEKDGLKGQADILFFVENRDKSEALLFMENRGLEGREDYVLSDEYRGVDIYRYALSRSYRFAFINSYMVLGNNEEVLRKVIDAHMSSNEQLARDYKYQKVSQNLPINNLLFSYLDTQKTIQLLKDNENFMSEKGRELFAFEPFLKMYRSFGLTALIENDNLALQTFVALDEDVLQEKGFIIFDLKFRAGMLEYLPENTIFYAGGLDLKKQIYRLKGLFGAGGKISNLIFEGMLRAQKDKYFGEEIKLEEDIYPLLEGEYAFSVAESEKGEGMIIILELQDPVNDRGKVEALANSFIRKSAILAPKIVEVELEDGTISQEIRTTTEEIKRLTSDYLGYEINSLVIGEQPWGVHYIILDNNLIVSSKKDLLKESISLFSKSGPDGVSLRQSSAFRNVISPALRTSDEVMYLNISYLISAFEDSLPEYLVPYLRPFAIMGTGKNYFKDGISTIHYIKID